MKLWMFISSKKRGVLWTELAYLAPFLSKLSPVVEYRLDHTCEIYLKIHCQQKVHGIPEPEKASVSNVIGKDTQAAMKKSKIQYNNGNRNVDISNLT